MVRIRCFLDALFLKSVDLQGQALRSLRCCAKDAHCKRWSREIEFYAEHKICFANIELAAPFQTCWTSHSFRCLDIKVIACIHVCFLDASNFKTAQILSCPGIQVSFKQPYVRQQRLDGSGPEACCSCTRVHGNQRRRLAKLLRPQFRHGCSLCNGAGLCSAPGEALSNPSRLLQKNQWVLFQFFPFVPSLAATSPLSGFSKFLGSLLLHFVGLFVDVSVCHHSLSLLSPLVMCW